MVNDNQLTRYSQRSTIENIRGKSKVDSSFIIHNKEYTDNIVEVLNLANNTGKSKY